MTEMTRYGTELRSTSGRIARSTGPIPRRGRRGRRDDDRRARSARARDRWPHVARAQECDEARHQRRWRVDARRCRAVAAQAREPSVLCGDRRPRPVERSGIRPSARRSGSTIYSRASSIRSIVTSWISTFDRIGAWHRGRRGDRRRVPLVDEGLHAISRCARSALEALARGQRESLASAARGPDGRSSGSTRTGCTRTQPRCSARRASTRSCARPARRSGRRGRSITRSRWQRQVLLVARAVDEIQLAPTKAVVIAMGLVSVSVARAEIDPAVVQLWDVVHTADGSVLRA